MLMMFAAMLAVPTPSQSAVAERRAQATVRIVRAARIEFGDRPKSDSDAVLRNSQVRERDGAIRPALLLEFS